MIICILKLKRNINNLEGLVNRDIKLSFFFRDPAHKPKVKFSGSRPTHKTNVKFDREQKKLPKSEFVYDHVKW